MKLTNTQYKDIVAECGSSREFNPAGNNYFVVLNHRNDKFCYFTVNDSFEAPDRFYMDLEVAKKVVKALNDIHLKD